MEKAGFRIIDANFNRSREALRVVEEFCRFALNSPPLTARAKQLRHRLTAAIDKLGPGRLLTSRDTPGDVGTGLKVPGQLDRAQLTDTAAAACRRLTEALRALAETISTFDAETAETIETLRYEAYTLEKDILLRADTRRRFEGVRLYVIITTDLPAEAIRLACTCADAGADCLQLRTSSLPDAQLFALAEQFARICRAAGTISIINNRTDIAVAAGADGVHLGRSDLPILRARRLQLQPLIFGTSTHNLDELSAAFNENPDYISVGPAFASTTKPQLQPAGLDYIRKAAELAREAGVLPVAIGGISPDNVAQVIDTGIQTVAVCSAVCAAPDPAEVCRTFKNKLVQP